MSQSEYQFPPSDRLATYLAMLRDVFLDARKLAYESKDERLGRLFDALENVPDLLCRWPDMDEAWVRDELAEYERRYNVDGRYTRTLQDGPRRGWQTKWQPK